MVGTNAMAQAVAHLRVPVARRERGGCHSRHHSHGCGGGGGSRGGEHKYQHIELPLSGFQSEYFQNPAREAAVCRCMSWNSELHPQTAASLAGF